jgi:hypothetical protein
MQEPVLSDWLIEVDPDAIEALNLRIPTYIWFNLNAWVQRYRNRNIYNIWKECTFHDNSEREIVLSLPEKPLPNCFY